jgi:hypothetical protein
MVRVGCFTNAHACGVVVLGLDGGLPVGVMRVVYVEAWCVPGLGSFIQLDLKARDHRVLRLEVPGDGRPVVAPLALFGMPGPEKKHRDPKRCFFPPPWQPNTTPK